jgi:hypothetical protein
MVQNIQPDPFRPSTRPDPSHQHVRPMILEQIAAAPSQNQLVPTTPA